MNDKQLHQTMNLLADEWVPETTDLWPAIQKRLVMSHRTTQKGDANMNPDRKPHRTLRVTAISLATLAVLALLLAFTPQGRVLAQQAIQFFTHASSDTLPAQTALPTSEASTPDPASILDAHATVAEVAAQAGFTVLQPASVPDNLTFSGASFDPNKNLTRQFFQSAESNGLVVEQEPVPATNNCELCGDVGASAAIEEVSIGDVTGQYVVGTWKLTDSATTWDADPYLQTMHWQKDGMYFELLYMGDPGALSKAEMISIAESMQ
jgi:hypothetical protein